MSSIIPSITEPTQKPANIRLAEKRDEQEIFDLLKLLALENALFNVNDDKVRETIQIATDQKNGMIGIIEQDGHVVGSVGLFIHGYWYTDDWHLQEYWNFVHPEYRRSNYAKNLIDFAKWVNENMGLILNMGIISTERTEAKVRLYGRSGLTSVGATFMNGILPGQSAEQLHGGYV